MARTPSKIAAQQPVININTQAPTAVEELEPEKPQPAEERAPRWFFDEIHGFPLQEWGRVWSMELHRMEPKIPGVPGSKGYLCMFLEPITIEAIRQRYGGGKFRLNLCKNGKWFRSHEFDIEGQPIYDTSRERPNANGNGAAQQNTADFQKEFISVLREELQRSRESNQGQPQGTDKVIEMMSTASDRAMEIVTKRTPQAGSATAEMREMIGAMKDMGLIGGAVHAQKSLLEQIVELVSNPVIGPKIMELFAPKDPLAEIAKFGAVFETLDKFRGGGGGGSHPKDWKAALVSEGLAHLPEVLNAWKDGTASNTETARLRAVEAENRRRAAEIIANRAQLPAAQLSAQPASVHSAAAPSTAPAAPSIRVNGGLQTEALDAPANPAPTAQPQPADDAAARAEFDSHFKVQIVNMLRLGCSGETIASFCYDTKPEFCKDFIKYTPEMVTQFFRADEILKLAVEDPRWEEVLKEAREFIMEEEAEAAKEQQPA
jgi:hypothetical protein